MPNWRDTAYCRSSTSALRLVRIAASAPSPARRGGAWTHPGVVVRDRSPFRYDDAALWSHRWATSCSTSQMRSRWQRRCKRCSRATGQVVLAVGSAPQRALRRHRRSMRGHRRRMDSEGLLAMAELGAYRAAPHRPGHRQRRTNLLAPVLGGRRREAMRADVYARSCCRLRRRRWKAAHRTGDPRRAAAAAGQRRGLVQQAMAALPAPLRKTVRPVAVVAAGARLVGRARRRFRQHRDRSPTRAPARCRAPRPGPSAGIRLGSPGGRIAFPAADRLALARRRPVVAAVRHRAGRRGLVMACNSGVRSRRGSPNRPCSCAKRKADRCPAQRAAGAGAAPATGGGDQPGTARDELLGIGQRAALLEDSVSKLADPDRHGAQ